MVHDEISLGPGSGVGIVVVVEFLVAVEEFVLGEVLSFVKDRGGESWGGNREYC